MPTVLRVDGFRVAIFFGQADHLPPHCHVYNGGALVVINLECDGNAQSVREIFGMSRNDVRRAEQIVKDNTDLLVTEWRRLWPL